MDFLLAWVVPVVVPILVGGVVLWLSRRNPALGARPAVTAVCLFFVLVVVSALDTPGGDLVAPLVGNIASLVICVLLYIELRSRRASTGDAAGR